MAIEAKPLPLDELEAAGALSNALWQGMGDNGTDHSLVGIYRAGVAQLERLSEIRAAQGSAESKLPTSDDPEAIKYREWKARADSRKADIDAEHSDQLKSLNEQLHQLKQTIASRKKDIDAKLNEQKQTALTSITEATRSDVNIEAEVTAYKDLYDQFNAIAKMFVDFPGEQFAALKGFKLPGPGVATGATKAAKGSGASGETKRFWWGQVTVNDETLDQPSTKDIAAKCKISEHGFKHNLLMSLNGDYGNLPRENADGSGVDAHTFEVNGHRVSVILRARTKKADSTETVAEQVAA